jgi:hypothetical protein
MLLIPALAWGQIAISDVSDTRNDLGALQVTLPGSQLLQARDGAVLLFQVNLPPGSEVQLWAASGDSLPWDEHEPNREGLIDSWVTDERTGSEVRLKLRCNGEVAPNQELRYYVRAVDGLYEMLPMKTRDLTTPTLWGVSD